MTLDPDKLRSDFTQLARETWFKLERGGTGPTSFGENSLTDHNLFMLDMKHPELNVHHFTQNEEVRSGADWEWWVGSDLAGWICLRVQAKRVRGHAYPELAHPGAEDTFQYDVLINGCDPFISVFPLHVFYNGWPEGEFRPGTYWADPAIWLACPGTRSADHCVHAKPRDYGCAVASSLAVKATHEAQTLAHGALNRRVPAHMSNALPWAYLWGTPNRRTGYSSEPNDWQTLLTDALRTVYTPASRRRQTPSDPSAEPSDAEARFLAALAPDSDRRLQPELPNWAQAVREKNRAPERLLEVSSPPARLIIVADFTPSPSDQ